MRSVNQNHHLYVATSVGTVSEASSLGAIQAVTGGDNMDKHLYFLYKGRDGVTRSDLIPMNQISYVKYVPASAQTTKLKKVEVALDSTINSGNAVIGQDYVLNIHFQQFYGLSPENDYVKTVAVHVTTANSTASDFYKAMVKELNAAFAREVGASSKSNPYLKFMIKIDGGNTYEEADFEGKTATGIVIEEKEQPWSLGKWEAESLIFNVFPSTIVYNTQEVEWCAATNVTTSLTEIPNNKRMADLEWFTFKERADYYGGMGYPNNFEFTPIVTTNTDALNGGVNGYDALEIHFAYQGTCEDIQKSEKDITIIGAASVIASLGATLGAADMLGGLSGNKVATPTLTYSDHKLKGVECATPNAQFKYNVGTTGSVDDPTASSGTAYVNGTTADVTLTSGQTIKVVAYVPGMGTSEVVSHAY